MSKIKPEALTYWRKKGQLTKAKLAEKAQLNEQTIWRLEHGAQTKTHPSTIEKLARALSVDSSDLTDDASVPQAPPEDVTPDSRYQLNVRVGTAARNALNLVARRYRVEASQIVELAPFLFFWAAEESLRERRERLSTLERALDETKALGRQLRHLSPQMNIFDYPDDAILAEDASIDRHDLFGLSIQLNLASVSPNFDEDTENPFAIFLRNLVAAFGDIATFEGWSGARTWSPKYRICREEAAKLVGGDPDRADEILNGLVALNEMPKHIRKPDMVKERSEWVRLKAEECRKQIEVDLGDLGLPSEVGESSK